jgi:hypothetical protein
MIKVQDNRTIPTNGARGESKNGSDKETHEKKTAHRKETNTL